MSGDRDEVVFVPQQGVVEEQPGTPVQPLVATPVVATPVVAAPIVAAPVVAAPVAQTVSATSIRRFAPDAVIAALVGLVVTVIGLIAITRAGIDDPIEVPIVEVLGFTHTAWLGAIEVGIGLGLLLSGALRSRSGAIFFGSILGIGAFVGAVQQESFDESLALESSFAWILVGAGAAVVLAALLVPRTISRRETVSSL